MRPRHFISLILLALAPISYPLSLPASGRPNIVFLLTDDQGWGDVGYNGHPHILTPNLDNMAASGMRFDRFYAAAAVCSPTRVTCLTGRNNWRVGITSPVSENEAHLPADEITIAEVLRDHGYATGHFGKWHVGEFDRDRAGIHYMPPWEAGFDTTFSTRNVVATYDAYKAGGKGHKPLYWDNGTYIPQDEGLARDDLQGDDSAIVMDKALDFIRASATDEKPFLALVWFHNVHTPLRLVPEHNKAYADLDPQEQVYYSNITAIDHQVGRLRETLRELGIRDDTMVWFASDNGPNLKGKKDPKFAEAQGGKFNYTPIGSTGAYRGWKRSCHEGGLIVPAVLEWPAVIKKPVQTSHAAVTSDYFPTVLDALGIPLPDDRDYDGISLMPLIKGGATGRPTAIGFRSNGMEAWTGQRYKLVRNINKKNPEPWQLYDLETDPFEENDIAAQMPEVVSHLDRDYQPWADSCKADETNYRQQ